LANGKTPPGLPTSEKLPFNVEDFDEPRTKLAGVFSILLARNGYRRERLVCM
jgi:hypothetical protein